jgi:hypothetical protein
MDQESLVDYIKALIDQRANLELQVMKLTRDLNAIRRQTTEATIGINQPSTPSSGIGPGSVHQAGSPGENAGAGTPGPNSVVDAGQSQ